LKRYKLFHFWPFLLTALPFLTGVSWNINSLIIFSLIILKLWFFEEHCYMIGKFSWIKHSIVCYIGFASFIW
jgi:hypothetical protein